MAAGMCRFEMRGLKYWIDGSLFQESLWMSRLACARSLGLTAFGEAEGVSPRKRLKSLERPTRTFDDLPQPVKRLYERGMFSGIRRNGDQEMKLKIGNSLPPESIN